MKRGWEKVVVIKEQNLQKFKSSAIDVVLPESDLVYHWDFENSLINGQPGEGAYAYTTDKKNGALLSFSNSPGMRTSAGYQGQGITFNNNFLVANNGYISSFDPNNATFDMWVKISAGQMINFQIEGYSYHGRNLWGSIKTGANGITLEKYVSPNINSMTTPFGVNPDQWTRVSFVFQGVGDNQTKYSIFIDGKHGKTMTTQSIPTSGYLILGKESWQDSGGGSVGLLDEVKIYKKAYFQCGNAIIEGAEQCDAGLQNGKGGSTCSLQCELVAAPYPASESSLVHYFPFEEGNWYSSFDSLGGIRGDFGDNSGFLEQGKKGKALLFGPGGGRLHLKQPFKITSRQNFTIDYWMNLLTNNAGSEIQIFGTQSNGRNEWIQMNALGITLGFWVGSIQTLEFPKVFTSGQWYRITIVHRDMGNGVARVNGYIDGEKQTPSRDVNIGDVEKFGVFGGNSFGRIGHDTAIDEFKIYNAALSDGDIAALSWCGNGVIEPPKEECDDATNNGTASSVCSNQCIDQTPIADPMGYWKFDEDSGTASKAASGFDLNLISGATFDNGQTNLGKSLKLDGVDDKATLATGRFLQAKAITFEAWIKPEDDQTKQNIVRMGSINPAPGFNLFLVSNNLYFAINADQGPLMASTGNDGIVVGNWYFVAVTYDASGEAVIYLNGARKAAASARGQIVYPPDGKDFDLGVQFKGNLDEVAFYNSARSFDEISAQYNVMKQVIADTPPPKSLIKDLIAYYPMEPSADKTVIIDMSGNNLGGLAMDGKTLSFIAGKLGLGQALQLKGETIRVLHQPVLLPPEGITNWTMSYWMKAADAANIQGTIVDKRSSRDANGVFSLANSSGYSLGIGTGTSPTQANWKVGTSTNINPIEITDTAWHFVTATLAPIASPGAGWTQKIFIDGKNVLTSTDPTATPLIKPDADEQAIKLFIGNGSGGAFKGLLDELRIYKRALTDAEILALYSALPPKDFCGNGLPNTGEQCDDGNVDNADACTNQCKNAVCGDGVERTGIEECDLGSQNSDTGACTVSCTNAFCGDSKIQAGVELCDDGNSIDTDSCIACVDATCGDGKVRAGVGGEECDLGNAGGVSLNVDTGACLSTCQEAECGDGKVRAGVEECEDGNPDATDSCNVCQFTFCGDGIIQLSFGEECDDNNTVGGDGCTEFCVKEAICGNGKIETGAVCTATDLITGKCTVYDLVTEECDPPGATCTAVCKNAPLPSQGGWNWKN